MGTTSTVTIGGNDYTVYGTYNDAVAYLAVATSAGGVSWAAATADQRKGAMVNAARLLDRQAWPGVKTSDSQPLAWPRTGVTVNGVAVDSATVPDDIVTGSYELAGLLLSDADMFGTQGTTSAVKRLKAGSAEVEYFSPRLGGRFPPSVQELVGPYLGSSASAPAAPKAMGTCAQSEFDDCDQARLK